jgi:taurine dioxygenase
VDLSTRPVTGALGAEIVGLPTQRPLDDAVSAYLRSALTEHSVIFIRDQSLEPERMIDFARAIGTPKNAVAFLENLSEIGHPEVGVISTESNPEVRQADNWHTDVAWGPEPLKATVLQMQAIPDVGGDTLWASQYLAYEWLSEAMKKLLSGLHGRNIVPHKPEVNAVHPLVIANPDTGRRAIFCTPFYTSEIIELEPDESSALLQLLAAHCTQPDLMCRWRWRAGDIAIWDNHYTMHYAVSDYAGHYRKIHRVEVAGFAPQAAAPS